MWGVPIRSREKKKGKIMTLFAIYIALLIFAGIPAIIFFGYPPVWVSISMLVPMVLVTIKNIKETL